MIENEKNIEKYLVNEVKKLKGICIKMTSVSFNGLPDRLVILPKGIMFFVEVKTTGQKPRPLQLAAIKKLENVGVKVYVADSKKLVADIIKGELDGNRI